MANTKSSTAKTSAKASTTNANMEAQMNGQMMNGQMMYQNPQMMNGQMMYQNPQMMNQGMNGQMMNPQMMNQNPQMMNGQMMNPQMMNQNPQMMNGQMMYQNPQMMNGQMMNPQMMYQQPKQSPIKKDDVVNFFKYILNVLYRPISAFKENAEKFASAKTTMIFTGIIVGMAMVINVIMNLIKSATSQNALSSALKSFGINTGSSINWAGETILFIIKYAVIIFAISGIFTLGGLIAKRRIKYMKAVAISTTALIPYIAAGLLVGNLFGLLFTLLGTILTAIGAAYTAVVFTELMTSEMQVEGDRKVHLLVGCYAVVAILFIIIFAISAASALTSTFGGLTSGGFNLNSFLR